jgi:hypothetical protein
MVDLTYDPKWYAILQSEEQRDADEDVPLAYITPFGTDAAFEKRKDTGLNWAQGWGWQYKKENEKPEIKQFEFDNDKPVAGYKITKSVSRYMTSNKAFRVTHPQGFQFEIYADNLAEILLNDGIVGGVLLGEYILTKQNNNIYLVKENDPRIVERAKLKVVTKVVAGDIVSYQKNRYTCVGELDMNWLDAIGSAYYYGHRDSHENLDKVPPELAKLIRNRPKNFASGLFNYINYTVYKFKRGSKNMFANGEHIIELTPKKFNLVSSGNPVPDITTLNVAGQNIRRFADVDITALSDDGLLDLIGRYRNMVVVYRQDGYLVVWSQ